jgi:hypothetical protein
MTSTGIAKITNKLNATDDPIPGQSVTDGQRYDGQVGAALTLNASEALKLSDTSVGTLYGGVYQYVRFYASQVGTTIKGGPVYWQDPDNFVVTADVPTSGLGFAGVALNVVTKGNYGWILVAGKCQCQPLNDTTKASPAVGDALVTTSTVGRFDDLSDAAVTTLNAGLVVGQWIQAPVDATNVRYLAYVTGAKRIAS